MYRLVLMVLISLFAIACNSEVSGNWTAEQLRAFELFRSANPDDRLAGLTTVATAFPVAFDTYNLQAQESEGLKMPRAELLELLGKPAAQFSLAEHPEYLGANGRSTNFELRDLQILIYDIDCLKPTSSGVRKLCSTMDVIMLKDTVLRVIVTTDSRSEASKWLRPNTAR